MRGRITSFWNGVFILTPDHSIGLSVYAHDEEIPPCANPMGLRYEFQVEVEPAPKGLNGMMHAVRLVEVE